VVQAARPLVQAVLAYALSLFVLSLYFSLDLSFSLAYTHALTPRQGAGNPLAALRQLPMFQQMRAMIRQNPAMLQPLLAQLAQSSPQLVQVG
jgi:hypothetical protein